MSLLGLGDQNSRKEEMQILSPVPEPRDAVQGLVQPEDGNAATSTAHTTGSSSTIAVSNTTIPHPKSSGIKAGDKEASSVAVESQMDTWAEEHPREFPQGDVYITFTHAESGPQNKEPVVGWAGRYVTTRSTGKKYVCLGIYKCPVSGCQFRERPRCPRRGRGKHASGGKVPPPQKMCVVHRCALVHVSCSCSWVRDMDEAGNHTLEHNGQHKHPAPQPIYVPATSLKKLHRMQCMQLQSFIPLS